LKQPKTEFGLSSGTTNLMAQEKMIRGAHLKVRQAGKQAVRGPRKGSIPLAQFAFATNRRPATASSF